MPIPSCPRYLPLAGRHDAETTDLSAILLRLFGIAAKPQMQACRVDVVVMTRARSRQIFAFERVWHAPA